MRRIALTPVASLPSTPSRPRVALCQLAPFLVRVVPWPPVVLAAAVAGVLVRFNDVPPPFAATIGSVIVAMGAAALLDDKAATTMAAVPVGAAWRRAVTLTLATPLLAISWWVQSEVGSPPGVGLAMESVLEALTLLVAMLAVAAVVIARGGTGTGGAPTAPALVVLVGLMMRVPERVAVYPVSDHVARWGALLALASVALAAASRDPARRSTTVIPRQSAGS